MIGANVPENTEASTFRAIFLGNAATPKTKPGVDDTDAMINGSTFEVTAVLNEKGEASVTADIEDTYGRALGGFLDFSIEGGASVIFDNNRKSRSMRLDQGIPVDDQESLADALMDAGKATATISGLPKEGPVKVKVTASYTNEGGSTFSIDTDITRQGEAVTVEAAAYGCVAVDAEKVDHDLDEADSTVEVGDRTARIITNDSACSQERANLDDSDSTNDPDEIGALGPGSLFFISAAAKDSADNTVDKGTELTWSVTPGADNADDAETVIVGSASGDTRDTIVIATGDENIPGHLQSYCDLRGQQRQHDAHVHGVRRGQHGHGLLRPRDDPDRHWSDRLHDRGD